MTLGDLLARMSAFEFDLWKTFHARRKDEDDRGAEARALTSGVKTLHQSVRRSGR